MARLKYKLTEPPTPPARGVKAETFRLLLDGAMAIIQESGHVPSVAEVAVRSGVSRATAYRYFTSRSALVTAVIDSSLRPVRTLASDNPNGRERVHELFLELRLDEAIGQLLHGSVAFRYETASRISIRQPMTHTFWWMTSRFTERRRFRCRNIHPSIAPAAACSRRAAHGPSSRR